MDDYLSKPFRRDVLLKLLARFARGDAPSSAQAVAPAASDAAVDSATDAAIDAAIEAATGTPSAAPDDDANVIDRNALDALRALQRPGRPDVLTRIIDQFNLDAPRLIGDMQAAVAAGDAVALKIAAHTLKSSSANVGAHRLSARCREIEQFARAAEVAAAADLVAGTNAEFERAQAALLAERVAG
ncbi:Hpt domain-containing protein [Burkholderia ubonensis]|uniref:Hpt domain-containing protein n=1 Tax=Burkholderia ubonensis TaxID=101571 RepID=UPI000A93FCC4|nr:Hpt domain-containing protein [Burkholderia ubonensis]